MKLSQAHAVQAMIFFAISKFSKKPIIYDELKKQFLLQTSISIQQEIQMEKVISYFNYNKMNHVLIKGYILRNFYPNKEARTSGDIDLLIENKDRMKCHKILLSLGYVYDNDKYINEVWTYKKNQTILEVHTKLVYRKLNTKFDYQKYCDKMVNNKKKIINYTYKLNDEDEFIYMIIHLAKHFYNAGVGIRMIIDIAVFINTHKSLNFIYINTEIKKIKLEKFANTMFFICKKYFNTELECVALPLEEEYKILEYILNYGVFGYDNKNIIDISYHLNNENRLLVLKNRLFPNFEAMSRFRWFRYKSKLMLPYAWIKRWLLFLFKKNKKDELIYKFKATFKQGTDSKIHNNILESVGLNNRDDIE